MDSSSLAFARLAACVILLSSPVLSRADKPAVPATHGRVQPTPAILVPGLPSRLRAYLPVVLRDHSMGPRPTPSPTPTPTLIPGGPRRWPDTSRGIHVFNDQLASNLSDAQVQFAARHYAGAQKATRSEADRLRAVNPGFLILHYRLGNGLGYRATQNGCQPSGDWIYIIEGYDWVQEWPGEGVVRENWFYHWPERSNTRVLFCDWGWYLMELNDAGWRAYWQAEVLRQVQANDNDGLFMDSLNVPNYMGARSFQPNLPDQDAAFERAWSGRITAWLAWLQTQPIGHYYLVPNVGSWINSRDATDYGPADGVMIEGFALEADASPHGYEDWQLEMNRALGLTAQGKAILAQSYAAGSQERMYALGCYLLIRGTHTFLNIDIGEQPEWWPEYDIPIGAATESAGTSIARLYDAPNQVYRRRFENGFVLVNPTNPWDGSGVTRTIALRGTYYLALTSGGGDVSESGETSGSVTYQAATQVTLPPYTAAVLLNSRP